MSIMHPYSKFEISPFDRFMDEPKITKNCKRAFFEPSIVANF